MHTHTWTEKDGFLTQTYTFADFAAALAFVNHVGAVAESQQHHPDICIENYNTVRIQTKTHDTGSITDKDHTLAAAIEALSA